MGQAVPYTADQLEPQFQKCLYKGGGDGICLQPDPIGLDGDDINLYAYVANNPVNYIDPWGLFISQVYRPLGGGLWPLGYHTAINVNGEIYGFTPDGVVREDPNDYGGWGSHENVIVEGNEQDQAMLDYLRNAAAGNDPRFTEDTYDFTDFSGENCYSFAECAIEEALNSEEGPCP